MEEKRFKIGECVVYELFGCEVVKVYPDLVHYDLKKKTPLGHKTHKKIHVSKIKPYYSEYAIAFIKEKGESIALNPTFEKPMHKWHSSEDTVVLEVIEDLTNRSRVGIEKYNTTLDRTDIDLKGWLSHAYEEALDHALYLKRAMREL